MLAISWPTSASRPWEVLVALGQVVHLAGQLQEGLAVGGKDGPPRLGGRPRNSAQAGEAGETELRSYRVRLDRAQELGRSQLLKGDLGRARSVVGPSVSMSIEQELLFVELEHEQLEKPTLAPKYARDVLEHLVVVLGECHGCPSAADGRT